MGLRVQHTECVTKHFWFRSTRTKGDLQDGGIVVGLLSDMQKVQGLIPSLGTDAAVYHPVEPS